MGQRRHSLPLAILALGLATLLGGTARADGGKGSIRGKLRLSVKGVKLRDLGPTVVYLDAARGVLKFEVPKSIPEIVQRGVKFSPNFLMVCAGQRVLFPNDDTVSHNVFSFSEKNEFDLGLYGKGKSKERRFDHPGVVEIFCSIHSSMSPTIFVSPSPWFARVRSDGSFDIPDVPLGKYRLKTWNAKLPESSKRVRLKNETPVELELSVGP